MQVSPRATAPKISDLGQLKVAISEKESEIVSKRNEYFRLIEDFKIQCREKQRVIEALTGEDAEKMKLMLQLRNKILEAEKTFELSIQEETKTMEDEFKKLSKAGKERLNEGDVRVKELSEQALALKEMERGKAIYELELFEWGEQCRRVQDKITRVKYDNQI